MTPEPSDSAAAWLLREAVGLQPDELGRLVAQAATLMNLAGATVYVVDHEQDSLHPLPGGMDSDGLKIEGTVAGRAYCASAVQLTEGQLWVPLLDGSDRLGVVGFVAEAFGPAEVEAAQLLTHAVSQLVVSKSHYTDAFRLARRTRPMTIGADLIWTLLPPQSFISDRVEIAAVLAPAYDLGGDAYDYALNDGVADLAIFDAMGHGTPASLLATLTLSTYRHGRRQGLDIASIGEGLDAALAAVFPDHFVTGHLSRLDINTGHLHLLNAGHHLPLLVRDGKVVPSPEVPPRVPFGLGPDGVAASIVALQPGDRVLFFTDGVIEAHVKGGRAFGQERLADLLGQESAAALGPAETLRRLSHAVMRHLGDNLRDDATLVLLQWNPPE